jgi:hypothetical protein
LHTGCAPARLLADAAAAAVFASVASPPVLLAEAAAAALFALRGCAAARADRCWRRRTVLALAAPPQVLAEAAAAALLALVARPPGVQSLFELTTANQLS